MRALLTQTLEQQLDHFDPAIRRQALQELLAQVERGSIVLPPLGPELNLHGHSFYSYNAYGYSPSKFAWLARKRGLFAVGLVDFDVLDGLEEFLEAGRLLGLKTSVTMESRVFVPEFADRVMNSPGEPGILYNLGIGFTRQIDHPFLTDARRRADQRNRELVARVNEYLKPFDIDYDRDVLPLTPNGNATERHICEAYAKMGNPAFWKEKLGDCPSDSGKLQALIRAKTMKKGGVGYVQPGKGSFPLLADMNRFTLEAGAIPMMGWLDGLSDGEQAYEELLAVGRQSGNAAILIIPDRNYTPGVKDQKLKNLYDVMAQAERHGLPAVAGTEMNAPGNKFVDAFETAELKPLLPAFQKAAYIVYAHTVLQPGGGLGYLSAWATKHFSSIAEKNEFFTRVGKRLQPAQEFALNGITSNVTPAQIVDRFGGI